MPIDRHAATSRPVLHRPWRPAARLRLRFGFAWRCALLMPALALAQPAHDTTPAATAAASVQPAAAASAVPAPRGPAGGAFSSAHPAGPLPPGWHNLPVVKGKRLTHYTLVDDGGNTVIQADADGSASALLRHGDIDLAQTPAVSWRWKVAAPITGADNHLSTQEDAPARLVFFFDGDRSKLTFGQRVQMHLAQGLAGMELPYATLMYIWSESAPPGAVIANPLTSRVQMIVVSGGSAEAGRWLQFQRDIVRDYEQVFHEKPGKLIAYGLLTDTDNTGTTARAWYGDLHFQPEH